MESRSFSHLDGNNHPSMVDVSEKPITIRTARAEAWVRLPQEVLAGFRGDDIQTPKGAVFRTAELAGVLAAKQTGTLIPLCHPLGLDDCQVRCELVGDSVRIEASAKVHGRTGVEMEALVAVTNAALTVYDMCKGVSHGIEIHRVRLLSKSGGRRDYTARD
jgi:cyclic pyranopterin phosphate synthase